jgi:hypothetical protein
MIHARSEASTFIDVLALDAETAIAVRAERASDRAFVELRHYDGAVAWQAMVPPYAGKPGTPGVAASRDAMSVRVVRDGRAEVFGMAMANASKLGGLKLGAGRPRHRLGFTLPAAVTLTDLRFSFELLGQEESPAWATLVAIDLANGRERWNVELGEAPITAAGLLEEVVWIRQGQRVRGFRTSDGAATAAPALKEPARDAGDAAIRILSEDGEQRVEFDRGARALIVRRAGIAVASYPWPAGARDPWPYQLSAGRLWIVFPDHLQTMVVDGSTPGSTLRSQ